MTAQEQALWVEIKKIRKRLRIASGGFTPTVHAPNHVSGSTDPIDITTLDGFPGGSPLTYLDSDGNFTDPASGSGIDELTGDVTAGPGSGSQVATLATTAVTPGTYGDATNVAQITVDAKGRITLAADVPISGGSGITELTGDVTAGPGSGSQAATIANQAVTNAKLANMVQATIKGRAAGAGTGDPTDLTAAQAREILALRGTVGAWLVTVNDLAFVECPYAGTIIAARIAGFDATGASLSGDAVVDVWKDTLANYPPTVLDTITASAKPTLTADAIVSDTTLTGWGASVAAGDWFAFKLESMSTIEKVLVQLTILKA